MEIEDIKRLCEENGMSTEGWFTRSVPENPVQIYDKDDGMKAIVNRIENRIRIYDPTVSRLDPVVDTGKDDWAQRMIREVFA